MDEDLKAEAMRDFESTVGAVVVDQDANIDEVGKFADSGFERFFRVVGGKHDGNALAVDHAVFLEGLGE
jgi:hypothetical protein